MEVTTDLALSAVPVEESCHTSASACELYRETIELGLSQGRNAMGIWQDLVDVHGFADGYQSVERFVRKPRGVRIVGSAGSYTSLASGQGAERSMLIPPSRCVIGSTSNT